MKVTKLLAFFMVMTLSNCDVIESEDIIPATFNQIKVDDDEYTTLRNTPIVLDLLKNDSIKSEVSITVGKPEHGVLTKDSSNYFLYQPEDSFVGIDSFKYTLCNKFQLCAEASVKIHVEDNGSIGNELITDDAILLWAGEYAVDGCGFILIIGTTEYKAENESFIDESFKEESMSEVIVTYKKLNKEIGIFCGDKTNASPDYYEAIKIIAIEKK